MRHSKQKSRLEIPRPEFPQEAIWIILGCDSSKFGLILLPIACNHILQSPRIVHILIAISESPLLCHSVQVINKLLRPGVNHIIEGRVGPAHRYGDDIRRELCRFKAQSVTAIPLHGLERRVGEGLEDHACVERSPSSLYICSKLVGELGEGFGDIIHKTVADRSGVP